MTNKSEWVDDLILVAEISNEKKRKEKRRKEKKREEKLDEYKR
jgi:hypothetical protein